MSFYFDSQDLIGDDDSALETGIDDLLNEDDQEGIFDQEDSSDNDTQQDTEQEESDTIEIDIKGQVHSLKQSEIEDVLDKYVKGEMNADSDPDYAMYKQAKPVIDRVRQSDILRQFVAYSAQGYSDEEILNGMFYLKNPNVQQALQGLGRQQQPQVPEEVPEFDTIEEETQYYVRKAVEQHLAPVQQQLSALLNKNQQQEHSATIQSIHSNNNAVLGQAMQKYGIEALSDDDTQIMRETLNGLFPNENLTEKRLTPVQAELLVQAALARQGKRNGVMPQAKDLSIQKKLPNILSASNKKQEASKPRATNYKQAVDDFFNNF